MVVLFFGLAVAGRAFFVLFRLVSSPAPFQRETVHLDYGNTAQAGMSRFGALSCIRAVKLDAPVVWVAVPNMNRR